MKKIKAFAALLLAFSMLLLSACGEEEKAEKKTEPETAGETALTEEGLTASDRAYLKEYLARYEKGDFDGEKLFDYQQFNEFLTPFEYKGLTYPADPLIEVNVTDEEVDDFLMIFFLSSLVTDDQYTDITDGAVQKYDVVTVDFRGLIDGVESEAASGTDQSIVIGSGSLIDGFESGLVGKRIGEEVRLDLSFSPYYHADDVAGKAVTFYVTVKKIQRPALPDFSLETVNEYYKTDFKSEAEAKAWFKAALETKEKNEAYTRIATYVQKKILTSFEVAQYPDRELEHYTSSFLAYYEQMKGDADWEVFCSEQLGMSYAELEKEAELYAKETVAPFLMTYYIAAEENLTCTTDQIEAFIEGYYPMQNVEGYYPNLQTMVEDCIAVHGADYFKMQVIGAMVSEKIVEYAVKEAV